MVKVFFSQSEIIQDCLLYPFEALLRMRLFTLPLFTLRPFSIFQNMSYSVAFLVIVLQVFLIFLAFNFLHSCGVSTLHLLRFRAITLCSS